MSKFKNGFKSIRIRLFFTLTIVVVIVITFLILLNNVVLETFYLYSKANSLKSVYGKVNEYYSTIENKLTIENELKLLAINNNFDILVKDGDNVSVFVSEKDYFSTLSQMTDAANNVDRNNIIIEKTDDVTIKKVQDSADNIDYLFLSAKLDNGYSLYMRMPITVIEESVKISNEFLYLIAGFAILFAAIIVSFVSRKFTKPILELNEIAKKMSNLDFSTKYKTTKINDEINDLGRSINSMSTKLEKTINQLRNNNIELERNIEEKSKLEDMRRSFISDVSHELKTPIALIQGYSEGLLENVNTDEESRKYYAEVIIDETNKMDKLVKQLLELMNLEYGKREFNNIEFNIVELEKEVLRKSMVMVEDKDIKVEFDEKEEINVFADDFYIEQVVTNYITNAIKYSKEVEGKRIIKVYNTVNNEKGVVRISVYNTGDQIPEEEIVRVWNRFYKADESRSRIDGSSGIGLSIVKAIMNNYENDFGVINKDNGVEFYFELKLHEMKDAQEKEEN